MTPTALQHIQPADHFSNTQVIGRWQSLMHHPASRIFIALTFLIPVLLFNALFVLVVIAQLQEPVATVVDLIRMAAMIPMIIYLYGLYCRKIESRTAVELTRKGGGRQWLAGALLAAGLVCLWVAQIAIFAEFEIIEYGPAWILLKNGLLFSAGALLQEVVLLCIVFRLLEEWLGTWAALMLSLMIFAGAHGLNPNQDIGSVTMLVLSSVILIAPFILTRQIWLSWGFHAGWNFTQAGVFGMANSGVQFPTWVVTRVSGPDWLTGGKVGIEGALLAVVTDLVLGIVLLILARRWGRLVSPSWRR